MPTWVPKYLTLGHCLQTNKPQLTVLSPWLIQVFSLYIRLSTFRIFKVFSSNKSIRGFSTVKGIMQRWKKEEHQYDICTPYVSPTFIPKQHSAIVASHITLPPLSCYDTGIPISPSSWS
jgi:hypothetical protein